MSNLSEKLYTSVNTGISYDVEIQKSQLAKERDEQHLKTLLFLKEAFKTQDIHTIIEMEMTFNVAALNSGLNVLNNDAQTSLLSSIDRAEKALKVFNSMSGDYSTYKSVIDATSLDRFDSRGLPKDPVRVFINSQRASMTFISSFCL